MSKTKNVFLKVCLMFGSILVNASAHAGKPQVSAFGMQANGVDYRIFVAVPAEKAPSEGFPVVYMTDGNRMLPIAAKLMEENPKLNAVFVGIGYPTDDKDEIVRLRYFDLTPPTPDDLIPVQTNIPKTGGRDAFFDFIDHQVKAEIEKRFAIDKNKQALFGHSLGGLFTLYALFNHSDSFQTYAAADPSIWWNGRSILADKDQFVEGFKANPKPMRLLIESSGRRGERPGQSQEDTERLKKLRGGPTGADIQTELKQLPGFEVAYRRFENESHGSMIPLTVEDSLKFILLDQIPNAQSH
ncbi:alpha/beta hydrolase [Brucella grignonensis]|uniref:Esterase family protein n=1 Tax=Brucella grignonensis TaxID=94627 RepID=A0A256FQ84_9HYPH|nr:alpha/beta hydrolase-fold protein [Brucella grignonensis]NKB83948.1 alpha/beta hydrolase [Brucella grignonensis]OYR17004.1 esterase family protein [Brucella grignonensis]